MSASVGGQAIALTPNATVPDGASVIVDQSFIAFGIESWSVPDYAGNGPTPNLLTKNLLATLSNTTGSTVYIRTGGTSMDHVLWDPSQAGQTVTHPDGEPNGLLSNATFGPPWVESLKHFENVKFTIQGALGRNQGDPENVVEFIKAVVQAIGVDKLEAIEIGNEPNLYVSQQVRSAPYGPADYVKEFKQFADAIVAGASLPVGPHFQFLTYASGVKDPWTEQNAFNSGVDVSDLIKTISYHYYQSWAGNSLQDTLMSHNATVQGMSVFTQPIQTTAQHKGIPFFLGEVGSALRAPNHPKDFTISASLGSALWTVDFMLYAMIQGVKRVYMQQADGVVFASWWPDAPGQAARVQSSWYGDIFVAELIGKEGNLQVAKLDGGSDPDFSAYAVYNNGKLTKVAIVNLKLWLASSNQPRNLTQVNLTLSGDVMSVQVDKLTGPSGDAQQNITFGGNEWSPTDGLPMKVKKDSQVLQVRNGSVSVEVLESEALLVTLQR